MRRQVFCARRESPEKVRRVRSKRKESWWRTSVVPLSLFLAPSCTVGEATELVASPAGSVVVSLALAQQLGDEDLVVRRQSSLAKSARLAIEFRRREPEVANYLERVAFARSLSERLQSTASEWAAVSDEELAEYTQRHWWQLDRPISVRTVHVVVRLPSEGASEKIISDARDFAHVLRARITDASDTAAFKLQLGDWASDERVKVEELPPVTADGRVIDLNNPPPPGASPGRFDTSYAAAAVALSSAGAISGIVRSSFGFHVILALEIVPGRRVPAEQRRRLLEPEIVNARAEKLQKAILAGARSRNRVVVSLQAMAFTGQIEVSK